MKIIIQGSNDGENWEDYICRYKPQTLSERPKQAAPHQPRLDWQLWFASLSGYQRNPWFGNLVLRLLHNTEDVKKLFRNDPFPDSPPKLIRAEFYRYRLSDRETLRSTGNYWTREFIGQFCPPLRLPEQEAPQESSKKPPPEEPQGKYFFN